MAVRGSEAKQQIIKKIFEYFPSAFMCNDNKELRIAAMENGERVEVKIALTCAKENLGEGDAMSDGEDADTSTADTPTAERQATLIELLDKMGVNFG